jgi:hypothetical protein
MIGGTFANDWLKLVLQAAAIASLADNAAAAPLATLYVAVHTADPGVGGSQTTNETAYTNYARVAVVRSAAGWTVAGAVANPVGRLDFPVCTPPRIPEPPTEEQVLADIVALEEQRAMLDAELAAKNTTLAVIVAKADPLPIKIDPVLKG